LLEKVSEAFLPIVVVVCLLTPCAALLFPVQHLGELALIQRDYLGALPLFDEFNVPFLALLSLLSFCLVLLKFSWPCPV
jgi:hypothetical protein